MTIWVVIIEKNSTGKSGNSGFLAIVLGSVLDGIPESIVIGLGLFHGGAVGIAMLIAVFASNLPEAISATSGLLKMDGKIITSCNVDFGGFLFLALASVAGFALFDTASPDVVAFVLAFFRWGTANNDSRYHDARGLRGCWPIGRYYYNLRVWCGILDQYS